MLLALLLPQILVTGAPTLLVPVFTRCSGSCPVTVMKLREKAPLRFRVTVLSFDPDDTPADLAEFRERMDLPAGWTVTQLPPAQTHALLDGLDFHFMKSERGFDHPNQTFVFSPRGRWAGTLNGSDFDGLDAAWNRALRADHPLLAWVDDPAALIAAAAAGLSISLAIVAVAVRKTA
ncbi:MAG TPA: hypothetical protein VLW85_12275 [Myxococcales bacterium]|nr:hypothetical protein [Myxococcales bacterium]